MHTYSACLLKSVTCFLFLAYFTLNSAHAAGPFTINGDGTVTDQFSGVMWQQEDDGIPRTWDDAISYCQNLSLAGHADWRLPNAYELAAPLDYSLYNPAVDSGSYPNTKELYWSGDTYYGVNSTLGLVVNFKNGNIGGLDKNENNLVYVRCVRGNSYSPLTSLSIGSADTVTVTDTDTKLIWQRAQSGGTLNWNDADAYCANLNLAGLGDWRLPSIKELQSLIDYSQINPAADATLFPDTNDDGYWSGSEYANTPGLIWNAHLGDGYTGWGGDLNNSYYYTRCIHDDSGITLNVTVNGAGQNTGTITSEPAGINCGTDCIEGYTNSSTVTLAATADSGASFSGWSGDCSGTDPATTITIDAAKSCTAAFTAAEETVTDIDTGLTWQRQDDAVQRTWSDANTYCQNLNSGGYDDWRSPSIYELADLPDYSRYNPVVDNSSYLNVKQRYWSGDGNAAYPVNAWFVDFKNGNIGHLDKSELNYIRCARGVSYSPLASLSVSSTDTVTDGVKNLTWQRTQSNAELNWSEANDYCANLVLAGLSEWRLPSIKELQQLIDYSQVNPAANATLFPNTNNAAYWSNSGSLNTPGFIWIAHLGGGYTGWGGDTNNSYYYARCVHNGINLSVTLTVNGAADQGTGTITSAPAGINCGADCTEDYANGATVTLAAAPGSGASFSGWSGDCSGADPAITVTMDAAKNCTAAFISDTVVTDAFTGLMWQQENDSISRSLSNATTYCQNLALAGYSDWRLPSIYELAGLPDYSRYNPAVDSSSFLNVKEWYWSGDGNAAYPNNAWFVDFKHGHINHLTKSELNYIRCVRGASYSPLASLSVSGTDTVADSVKNLTWQRTQSNAGLNWSDADAYCTDLVLAGLSEWRLPSIKELQQLIDYSQVNPAANATLFPNTNALYYWSNSEHANMPGIRWAAHLGDGNTGYVQPGELYYARCVHNTIGNELLTVNSAGQGSGTITSNPAGINCGADCTENYANGATVTLSAAPESGASFSGWSGDCSSTDPAITVTMDAAKSCTAEFTIPCSYASDITESAHTAEAGNSSFNLTAPAGCAWTGIVDSNAAAWLSLTVSTGTDSGEITYYFTENTDTSARTGTIQVNGANITVTQEEAKYIPPTAGFTAEPAQGRAPLDVTVDASASNDSDGTIIGYEWALFLGEEQIQSNAGQQASFSLTEGGTYKIVLTVTDNDGLANTAESELPVKPPCNYTTNITERTHAAEAGSGSFDLTAPAGCEWTGTVDSNAVAWLSLSPLNGAGDGTITYSFTENTDASARTGTIQVNGANIITVTQEGIPPTADFAVTPGNTPLEIKLDASASTGRIIRYDWIITDGANTHELFGMTVTFSAPGEALYQITLTVIDSNDLQDSISKSVPIGELISFEGFKAQYCPGDSMQADVIENASLARSENTDLWVWFEYQDSVLYVLPPVEPFPQRSNLSGDPSSFKTDIPPADKIHSVWEFEAPPLGMPFSTTFHAQYVLAGKNPLTGGADDVLSNKASQTITLFPANSPECQGYGDDDFTPIDSAVPNTVYRSNSIPLDWLSGQTQASISGGQQTVLIINGQNTFSADSLVNNGDTLAIQTLSPPISNSVVIALTIGQQTLKWSIASAPLDSVPVMEGAMAGSTAGEFTVNEAGASVYQIPITVSPGTAGIQPVLSLAYSSQGNDGPVGIGWSLTGLSVISRCPATLAQDGFIDGIDFDDNDRFCLDGERLIAVNGEYGADQTEYRTEQNNFSRIISHGSAGNGPAYFIVETKAGLIMGYGLNDDSRIEAHGREEVLSWAVSRVQDTLGNYYSVTYQEETTHTEYRPLRIDYTSNDNAGLLPYNSVEFSYEDRVYQDNSTTPSTGYTDSFFRYIGGAPLKTTKRLYKIQALENNAVYREYRLTYKPYESDAMIYRSRLASIQECGSDDSCFAPTAFEWQEDATTKFDAEYDLIPQSEIDKLNGRKGEFYPADWNGDGLTDMLWVEKYSGKNIFYLNKRVNGHCPHDSGCYDKIEDVIESSTLGNQWTYSGGYFYFQNCKFTITPSEKDFSQLQLGDWNGDGLTDFMVYKPVDCRGGTFYRGGNYWYVNNGDMTFSVASNPISSSLLQGKNTYTELVTGDWNGDGRTDIMWHQPGLSRKSRWFINAGPSDNQDINFTDKGEPFVIGQTTQVRLGDWNGDGITDVMVFGNEDWWYINDGNLNMTLSNPLEELYGDDDFDGRGVPYFGDWNGDGITDFMYRSSDKTRWYINHGLMSDGKLKFTLIEDPISNDAVQSSQLYLGDRNGDGISDLFLRNGGENHWYVNNGNLNFTITENNISQGDISAGDIYTGDWNGDGIMDVLVYNKDTGDNSWHVSNITRYNLLTKITDGHGKTVEISYKPLTSNDVFLVKQRDIEAFIGVAESSVAYPELDMRAPLYVVDSYYADNGIGGRNKSSYRYVGARMNLHGRGFRGFMLMEVNDEASGRCRITQFSQDYRHAGSRIVKSTEYAVSPGLRCFDDPNAKVVSETENTLAYKKWPDPMQGYEPACVKYDLILFPLTLTLCSPPPPEQEYGLFYFSYIKSVITKQYELDALKDPNGPPIPFRVKTIDQEYDDYGNPTNITINHGGGYTETTVNTYDNNTSQWHLGRLRTAKVTKTVLGQAAQTRVSAFEYSSTTGLLTKEIIQPGDPLCLEKAYTHDSYGNVRTSATRGCSSTNPPIESRTHTTEYDNDGRFVIKSINTLGHEETKTYEHGNLASRTGPNGLTTTWEYDGFGRQILETRADGAQTRASYHLCSGCFPNSVYYVWTEASGSPPSAVVYDKLDREIVRGVYAFGGEIILAETRYNDIGQTIEVSEPYFLDIVPTSRLWTQNQYDALSRIKRQTVPDGGAAITEYQGLTTVVTNPLGQRSTRTINALGQLARSEDNQGNALTYIYDAFGNLIELRDPENNVTQISYDIRGNKKQLIDPDTGTTSYQYNALGELLSQTDNKNQTVTMRYDRLGRMIERAAPEGLSTWEYDTATNGIGKLAKVTCVTCADGYAQTLRYDSFGRPDEVIVTIDGKPFPVTAVYDRYGRKDTVTYPSGFAVKNIYDQRGYLSEVRNAASDKNYWKAQTVNARGQFESFTLGNGLNTQKVYDDLSGRIFSIQTSAIQNLGFEFDELGNLKRRNKNGRIETFTYDDLNRLKRAAVQDGESVTLDYDALGNIKYKSDVGSYSYGANGAGPHAVTGVNGVLNNTYQYDLNGNRISAEREGQTIDYTSYNKPSLISQGGTSLEFYYGPDHSRYRQTVNANGMTETKLYIGSLYEQVSDSGLTKKIHYIFAGGKSIAVYTSESDGEENTRYLHKDHLGSIDAISDEQGDLVESLSFDAWGKRRNPDWTSMSELQLQQLTGQLAYDRGFTGHEHLDEVMLIHMNGRVYDPVLGRFLSADIFIQFPEYTQGLNRYTYVLNNPLALTDPSGHFIDLLIGYALSAIVENFIIGAVGQGIVSAMAAGAAFGFGQAFSGALMNGSNLNNALNAGLRSGMIGGITQGLAFGVKYGNMPTFAKILSEASIHGLNNLQAGGQFEDGFLSGLIFSSIAAYKDAVSNPSPNNRVYHDKPLKIPENAAYAKIAKMRLSDQYKTALGIVPFGHQLADMLGIDSYHTQIVHFDNAGNVIGNFGYEKEGLFLFINLDKEKVYGYYTKKFTDMAKLQNALDNNWHAPWYKLAWENCQSFTTDISSYYSYGHVSVSTELFQHYGQQALFSSMISGWSPKDTAYVNSAIQLFMR